jgi:hypothetical protein
LDGLQNREQQVTTCAVSMPPKRESPLEFDVTLASTPSGHGLPQDRIHGPTLFERRLLGAYVNIQFGPPYDWRLSIHDCRLKSRLAICLPVNQQSKISYRDRRLKKRRGEPLGS